MSEFEDKLQSILGDPQAMGQIMALAQSISGGSASPQPPDEPPEADEPPPTDPLSALGELDPRLLRLGMRLISEYQSADGRSEALLTALQPFLREPRQGKMERAIRISRLAHVIRVALDALREGDAPDV